MAATMFLWMSMLCVHFCYLTGAEDYLCASYSACGSDRSGEQQREGRWSRRREQSAGIECDAENCLYTPCCHQDRVLFQALHTFSVDKYKKSMCFLSADITAAPMAGFSSTP